MWPKEFVSHYWSPRRYEISHLFNNPFTKRGGTYTGHSRGHLRFVKRGGYTGRSRGHLRFVRRKCFAVMCNILF